MPSRKELTDGILAIRKRNSPPLSTLKKPELAALLAKLQGAKDMPAPAPAAPMAAPDWNSMSNDELILNLAVDYKKRTGKTLGNINSNSKQFNIKTLLKDNAKIASSQEKQVERLRYKKEADELKAANDEYDSRIRKKGEEKNRENRLVDIANNIIEANKDEIDEPDSDWLEYNFANSFEAILKQQEGMNSKEIIKSMKDISSKFKRGGDTRLSIDTWLEENDVTPEQKAEKIETRRKEKEDYQALLDREIVKIEERNITSQNIALDKLKQRKIDLEDEIATAIINLHISTTNLERLREIRDAKKK